MSVTQGGQIPGQPRLIHPRLDVGEARRGGEVRDSSFGDQMAGGGHLRDADARPHVVVTVFGHGVAGIVADDDKRGGRCSDVERDEATEC